ncbi:MAG: MFS transporter, partial [Muribaculaceae bacterium]|nr:MFS transporter [Muribaculaceae bacterium]
MTKVIKKSAVARWLVLIIVSLTMMMGYVVAKEMSPLQYLLELPESLGGMGWSSTEFGLFAGSRGFFNVFFLMLFLGGVILDKMGVRFTGVLSCALMVVGTAINYYALQFIAPHGTGLALPASGFTIKEQVLVAALGFAVFGIGYEMCGITVSKVIVKWFTGGEMALAMGLQVSLARLGTALALSLSPVVAQKYSVSTPVLVGLVCVVLGLLIYVVYCVMDARRDRALAGDASAVAVAASDEGFHLRDLGSVVKNPGFVLITMLCLLYYSALYPFLDFATKLMITKYGVEPQFAGHIPAILPFGSIILTPLFGALYDHHGHGAWFMIVGTVMLTAVLVVFALPL